MNSKHILDYRALLRNNRSWHGASWGSQTVLQRNPLNIYGHRLTALACPPTRIFVIARPKFGRPSVYWVPDRRHSSNLPVPHCCDVRCFQEGHSWVPHDVERFYSLWRFYSWSFVDITNGDPVRDMQRATVMKAIIGDKGESDEGDHRR